MRIDGGIEIGGRNGFALQCIHGSIYIKIGYYTFQFFRWAFLFKHKDDAHDMIWRGYCFNCSEE